MSGRVEASREVVYEPWGAWDVTLVVASVGAVAAAILIDQPVLFGIALASSLFTALSDRSYTVIERKKEGDGEVSLEPEMVWSNVALMVASMAATAVALFAQVPVAIAACGAYTFSLATLLDFQTDPRPTVEAYRTIVSEKEGLEAALEALQSKGIGEIKAAIAEINHSLTEETPSEAQWTKEKSSKMRKQLEGARSRCRELGAALDKMEKLLIDRAIAILEHLDDDVVRRLMLENTLPPFLTGDEPPIASSSPKKVPMKNPLPPTKKEILEKICEAQKISQVEVVSLLVQKLLESWEELEKEHEKECDRLRNENNELIDEMRQLNDQLREHAPKIFDVVGREGVRDFASMSSYHWPDEGALATPQQKGAAYASLLNQSGMTPMRLTLALLQRAGID